MQLGIAIGFLVPPILVPNVEDVDELAHHIRVMFYISAGVATIIFILVVICKSLRGVNFSPPLSWSSLLTHAAVTHCDRLACLFF